MSQPTTQEGLSNAFADALAPVGTAVLQNVLDRLEDADSEFEDTIQQLPPQAQMQIRDAYKTFQAFIRLGLIGGFLNIIGVDLSQTYGAVEWVGNQSTAVLGYPTAVTDGINTAESLFKLVLAKVIRGILLQRNTNTDAAITTQQNNTEWKPAWFLNQQQQQFDTAAQTQQNQSQWKPAWVQPQQQNTGANVQPQQQNTGTASVTSGTGQQNGTGGGNTVYTSDNIGQMPPTNQLIQVINDQCPQQPMAPGSTIMRCVCTNIHN